MIQLKNRTTGQIIEVDEIDSHWYNGHEDYEAINVETAETIEAEPKPSKKEGVKNGSLETFKIYESNDGNSHENGENAKKQDGKGNEAKADERNEEKKQMLTLRKPGRPKKYV